MKANLFFSIGLGVIIVVGAYFFFPLNTNNTVVADSCCYSENATCRGSSSCRACKNCKFCKFCSIDGNSCGVCR